MDTAGENAVEQNEDDQRNSDLNLSDVLKVLQDADGSPEERAEAMARQPHPALAQHAYVRIVEQPAPKALRFRYECEGRSAGSIQGVNSTPDRRTFPTIEIGGYVGTVLIVVCCVTCDEPYLSHPHKLVGSDCKNGVHSVRCEISPDSRTVSFPRLGVQCVKRKDVADALLQREHAKIDPFRHGFAHRHNPQSINLNAVRLCFSVYLEDGNGHYRHRLPPAVSDVVYDKKAMSELLISRVSACTASARGGLQIIMLCDKVNRDEITVVFEERKGDAAVWRDAASIDHVHKLCAIVCTVPAYRNPKVTTEVETYLFLERRTDKACSNEIKFKYLPEFDYSGTARKPRPDLSFLSLLLADPNNNKRAAPPPAVEVVEVAEPVSSTSESVSPSEDSGSATLAPPNGDLDVDALDEPADLASPPERSLDDLLDQVAELDEIYSESRTRLEAAAAGDGDAALDADDFDDAGTYTSLQLAFKNPLPIADPDPAPYEDVQVHAFRGPIVEFAPLKRDGDDERAPPLPPKRVRKASAEALRASQTSVDGLLRPGRPLPVTRDPGALGALAAARSEPALPPAPKKRSFLSRLFRRKEKSPAPSVKSEGAGAARAKPVGRSVSSVSGLRPARFKASVSHGSLREGGGAGLRAADSVTHISLHGEADGRSASQPSLRPASAGAADGLPPDGTILVAESVLALDAASFRRLRDDLELTEAEHYALYMAVAPHATASEFDETSCYYSPVDASRCPMDA
ncbi:embryonic polarity protein dorsal [Epargyreus clarus]|uniref:embryonic polarity protein dorsal n=1 Tax=Epargyreus clarus TaxID=520877 RepID=UPI003C2EA7CC